VTDRLIERVTSPEDADLQVLLAEIDELKGERNAAEKVAEGVAALADDLEEAA
jgi:hypothetical protein